jgi:hypothetical protein
MKKRLFILLTAFTLFPILLLAGCQTTASLVSRVLTDNDWPKKRVMIMPATDLTGIGLTESIDLISEELTKILKKTGFFNIYPQNKTKKFHSFKPGELIDPELLREAKEMGMNAIIFETINPIDVNPAKSGIWPFRKKAWRYTVSMNIDILDVNRETILLSKEIADKITLPSKEATEETEKAANAETKKRALKECLQDILKRAEKATCLSLNHELWTGRIISINKKKIIINVGRDVGLRPAVVLEVFDKGECITSFKEQTYQLPDTKVGEIKIVNIKQRHSYAEPIKEGYFKPGQIIRIKD